MYWVSTTILQVAGVDDVGQREVDQPVDAAERHRRFGAVGRERHQPLPLPPREDDGQDLGTSAAVRHGPTLVGRLPRRDAGDVARVSFRANRHPQQGVPAGDLRRSGGPRGRARRGRCGSAATSTCGCTPSASRATRTAPPATPTSPSCPGPTPPCTTLGVDLSLAAACEGADLVHSHTWYANMAGHLASLMGDIPHVLTAHSLEPMRPWKAEQLGGGYRVSSWVEKTAYEAADAVIAVSAGMREDILRSYPSRRPRPGQGGAQRDRLPAVAARDATTDVVRRHGVDPDRPSVIFVGRHHPAEGPALPPARGGRAAARGAARAARRRPRHPRDQGRGRGPHRRPARDPGRGRLGRRRCCRATRSSRC